MGILDKAKKIKLVEQDSDPEEQRRVQNSRAEHMWHWLRLTLDDACDRYQHEGRDELLRECLTGEALAQVKGFLDQMRNQNMVWAYPKERRNDFSLQLNSISGDTYVVTEYFKDHSYIERYQGGQLVERIPGDGADKVLRATIVADGEAYRIAQVALISDPTQGIH